MLTREKILFNPPELGCVLSLTGLPESGPVILDRSPYGNHSTITSATWTQVGQGLWVMSYNGSSKVVVPNHASLNMGTGDFSLGIWAKIVSSVGSQHLMSKGSSGAGNTRYFFQVISNGTININIDDNTNDFNGYSVSTTDDSVWRMYSVSVDRDGTVPIYFNGVVDGIPQACTATLDIDMATKNFCIGVDPSSENSSYLENGAQTGLVWVFKGIVQPASFWLNLFNQTRHLFGV